MLSFLISILPSIREPLQQAAPKEFMQDPDLLYVVYGHTHEPMMVRLATVPGPSFSLAQTYLNIGTWRARHCQATQDGSFVSCKYMTFVIFYRPGEREEHLPSFETWTGTLKA